MESAPIDRALMESALIELNLNIENQQQKIERRILNCNNEFYIASTNKCPAMSSLLIWKNRLCPSFLGHWKKLNYKFNLFLDRDKCSLDIVLERRDKLIMEMEKEGHAAGGIDAC